MGFTLFQTQRVQIGEEMPAHAIDADHHQRTDAVQRRGSELFDADPGRC
jgi:hypothetical protein